MWCEIFMGIAMNTRITLDYFKNVSNYYHIYKLSHSKVAEVPHYHDFFQVCYLSKGAIKHRGEREEVSLVKGDSFIIPPNFSHSLVPDSDDPEFYSLSFKERIFYPRFSNSRAYKFLTALQLDTMEKDHLDIRLKVTLDEQMQMTIESLLECLMREFPLNLPKDLSTAGSLISAILLVLARAYFSEPIAQQQLQTINVYYKAIMACKDHIDQNYMKDLSLSQMTKQFGLSRSVLCMLFPKIVGKPLKQYISERRIKQAACLSDVQDLSFQEIAEIVGYEDYSTFFRNFHKIIGISPIQYRNNKAEKTQNPAENKALDDASIPVDRENSVILSKF